MTLFEYLAIAFSLVYSLAALRLLGGLPSALEPGRRSPLHLVLSLTLLYLVTISFWVFWSLRDVAWTFGGFLLALMIPGTLYYCAAVLIPENPEDVDSWDTHYFAVHRRCFGGLALWAAAAALSASVNLGMGLAHPARLAQGAALTIGLVGASSSTRRVHMALAVVLAILTVVSAGGQLSPSWLAAPR
jgi:hypothetical protein